MKASLFFLFLILSISAYSQRHHFDVKGGLSWCNQSGNFSSETEQIQRISVGVGYEYRFANKMKLGFNLMYSESGFKLPTKITDELGSTTSTAAYSEFNYDYLSIPIKVGYEIGEKLFAYGNGGIYFSYLMNSTTSAPIFNSNLQEVGRETVNATKNTSPFEIGAIIELGAGITFFDRFAVYVEGGFQHSFTSTSTEDYFAQYSILNYRLSANLGLRFKL